VRAGTRVNLLRTKLVLIAPKDSRVDLKIAPGFALAAALDGKPLATCNPASHPAGRFGRLSLESLGVWPSVADKVARLEHVQAAVAMTGRGEVALAIVFEADVAGNAQVRIVDTFPETSHPPIVYPVAILTGSRNDGAADFLAYLRGPE